MSIRLLHLTYSNFFAYSSFTPPHFFLYRCFQQFNKCHALYSGSFFTLWWRSLCLSLSLAKCCLYNSGLLLIFWRYLWVLIYDGIMKIFELMREFLAEHQFTYAVSLAGLSSSMLVQLTVYLKIYVELLMWFHVNFKNFENCNFLSEVCLHFR